MATLGVDTEGLDFTPSPFGPYALGTLVVASEGNGRLTAILPNGTTSGLGLVISGAVEMLSFVPLNLGQSGNPLEGFYGARYPSDIQHAGAGEFLPYLGDAIVTTEGAQRVVQVHWDGSRFIQTDLGSFNGQPEDGIFVTQAILHTNHPPVANAGPDQIIECTSSSGASVSLDGSLSSDPDGDALTYTWTGSFGTASGVGPTIVLPLGTHTITLTVSDGQATSTDTVDVTVHDTLPPSIGSVTASPSMLWPPNHKMVSVSVAAAVTDGCDAAPTCNIISVSSNEAINGLGDGDTSPDWMITGPLTVDLRAERSGKGTGRIYTITIQCADASGNSATQTVTVTVPHDQGKK